MSRSSGREKALNNLVERFGPTRVGYLGVVVRNKLVGVEASIARLRANGLGHLVDEVYQDWRCGYVAIPYDHPWFGMDYKENVESGPRLAYPDRNMASLMNEIGAMNALIALLSETGSFAISSRIRVHGGLTFSGDLDFLSEQGIQSGSWFFGFDCHHADDKLEDWTVEKVWDEVERLAEELSWPEQRKFLQSLSDEMKAP